MIEHDHADSTWNRAVHADEHGDPFCCRTEWQLSYYDAIAPGRPLHVRASGDSLIAFAEREADGVTPPDDGRLRNSIGSRSWRQLDNPSRPGYFVL